MQNSVASICHVQHNVGSSKQSSMILAKEDVQYFSEMRMDPEIHKVVFAGDSWAMRQGCTLESKKLR